MAVPLPRRSAFDRLSGAARHLQPLTTRGLRMTLELGNTVDGKIRLMVQVGEDPELWMEVAEAAKGAELLMGARHEGVVLYPEGEG